MGRSADGRSVQIGKETTAGTAVSAGKYLPSMSLEISPDMTREMFRAAGYNLPSTSVITKNMGSVTLNESPLSYSDTVYPMAMALGAPTITTPGGGTSSRQHLWTVPATGAITPLTFTIQQGDATACEQAAYCILKQFQIKYEAGSSPKISGSGLCRTLTQTTLSSTPTAIAESPVSPRHVTMYMDAVGGTLGSTAIGAPSEFSFDSGSVWMDRFVLNAGNASFKDLIQTAFEPKASFIQEHDSTSRTLQTAITPTADTKYLIRFEAIGPLIEGSLYNKLWIDFVATVTPKKINLPNGGVYAMEYDLTLISDSTFAAAFKVTMVNTITAL